MSANAWKGFYEANKHLESGSGYGSFLVNTVEIRSALPRIFLHYQIHTILDVPCGDWNWMAHVDLSGVQYTGADIVPEVIERNRRLFHEQTFLILDATKDLLPKADLILCRDFLFHLSESDIFQVIRNCKESGSRYLLTTTFHLEKNVILSTGEDTIGWRPVNVEIPPYDFPKPLEEIQENKSHACRGRFVSLYSLEDIKCC